MTRSLRADAHQLGAPVALLAEAATVDDVDIARRIITGTVVPYGEPGRTNLGLRAVRAGAVTFRQPSEPRVIGLYGHDRERTVSRLIAYENGRDRLRARFRVARTPLGDQLLAEADPSVGVRSMLSIELDGVSYDPASGDIIGGLCEFVAHVPIGAYDSATVDTVAAALHPSTGDPDVHRRNLARARFGREFITVGGGGAPGAPAPQVQAPAPAATPAATPAPEPALTATAAPVAAPAAPAPAPPALDLTALAAALAPHLAAAAAPAGLPTGGALVAAPSTAPGAPAGATVEQLARLQAGLAQGDTSLTAALADITNSDLPIFQRPASTIAHELWSRSGYTRRWVPLMTPQPLTSYKVTGWEWRHGTGPEVDDWGGDKTPIPSSPGPIVDEVETTAKRLAGGWDIDRKFRDFGDSAFWLKFYAQQTESYARKTDAKALAAILAASIDITDGTPTLAAQDTNRITRPAGWTPVAQADVLRAVAYGTAYLEDTPLIEQGPDYVVVNTQDWLGLLELTNLDLPAFLALLNVTPEQFRRSSQVPSGSVVLGVKRATEWYELPGTAPIRVEALDVARGGIDSAVFGYWATLNVRPGGIISVPLSAG